MLLGDSYSMLGWLPFFYHAGHAFNLILARQKHQNVTAGLPLMQLGHRSECRINIALLRLLCVENLYWVLPALFK